MKIWKSIGIVAFVVFLFLFVYWYNSKHVEVKDSEMTATVDYIDQSTWGGTSKVHISFVLDSGGEKSFTFTYPKSFKTDLLKMAEKNWDIVTSLKEGDRVKLKYTEIKKNPLFSINSSYHLYFTDVEILDSVAE